MKDKRTNIVVVGQGAIGLLWYHHLSQASIELENTQQRAQASHLPKANITLLASNHKTLSTEGITQADYQFTAYQQSEANSFSLNYCQASNIENADIVLLCLKSYQIANAITSLRKSLSAEAKIILAHNGMGTFEEVSKLLPDKQIILAMLTTHGCLRNAPLNITHTGLGHTDIGLLQGKLSIIEQTKLGEQLTQLLATALPEVSFHQNIASKQWLKLAINCVINPITAINNIDNGEVNNDQFSRQSHKVLTEVVAVAKAEGIELALTKLIEIVANVAAATAKNCSSMRCDVLAKKPTEIDFINGYIHRLGEKHNIATPENTQLWQQIKKL